MPAAGKVMQVLRSFPGFDKVVHGVKIVSASNGSLLAELKLNDEHVNYLGGLHGGFSATLVDTMTSMALITHEKGAHASVSVTINLNYIGSAKLGDTIQISGTTLKVGKTLAFLQAEIRNKETGALLVKGSHTKFIMH